VLESRRLGTDVALGYLAAEFGYPDAETVHLRVGVVVTRTGENWRIAFYQASAA
jgi:hypothetical protein